MEKAYKFLKVLILILSIAVVIAGASLLYNNLSTQVELDKIAAEETVGETNPVIPDFTIYDREGTAHKLSDFRGKPVILNFWATWCGFCVMEMPEFQKFYEQYGEDIQFIMLNATDGQQETMESATAFVDDSDYTFPVYYDTGMEGIMTFGINSFPTTIMIDAQGRLVSWVPGMMSADSLQQAVDKLLA